MLVYTQLGEAAVASFSRSFGISWAMGQAAEWQDIAKELAQATLIMLILERLMLSSNVQWVEEHGAFPRVHCCTTSLTPSFLLPRLPAVDFIAVQAAKMDHQRLGWWGRVRTHAKFSRRLITAE